MSKKKYSKEGSRKFLQKKYDAKIKRATQGGQFHIPPEKEIEIWKSIGSPGQITRTKMIDYGPKKRKNLQT